MPAGPIPRKPRCYVASPTGFSEAGRYWCANVLLPLLAKYVDIVDPWSLTTAAEVDAAYQAGQQGQFWLEIGHRNLRAIETCQVLVAVLDGEPPDIGTVAELAWAARAGLRVIGYRSDMRQSGEEGVPVNLMIPAVIERSHGTWVSTLAELEEAVAQLCRGRAAGSRADDAQAD